MCNKCGEVSCTIHIVRIHVLISVHIFFTVVSRRSVVFVVFIIASVRRVVSAIILTPSLGLAGSTLELVKLSEEALVHVGRSRAQEQTGSDILDTVGLRAARMHLGSIVRLLGAGEAKSEVGTKLGWDEEGALLALATYQNHNS